ncbi:hypothetical protein Dsin_004279 [Dipteronia sinensis]|uniref:RNase H type-1 domain-containing protein n=1 Tax=Dipteronia sinensis TaxID=43782 RepID=A0AAE0BAJ8_9ROSI|nr:hypothetical protein Dsin_004279 [Dipteronia sinensis]
MMISDLRDPNANSLFQSFDELEEEMFSRFVRALQNRSKNCPFPIQEAATQVLEICKRRRDVKIFRPLPQMSFLSRKASKQAGQKGWIPPPAGVLMFNVDGLARGNPGKVGIGGVLRDFTWRILYLFSFFVGILDSSSAEIQAIHMAVTFCVSNTLLHDREILIVSDSKTTVS